MARAAPGVEMLRPSQSTSPLVRYSSPARMRSSVDLPQPEAPTRVMNSLSSMLRLTFSRAGTGLAARSNTLPTWLMMTLDMFLSSCVGPGVQAPVQPAKALIHDQTDHANQDDAAE